MAWNEPGNENKDPWGRRKNEQGPPDLDEIVKKVQDTLGNLFGGGGSKNGGSSRNDDGDEGGEGISGTAISVIAAILLIIWGLFGLYMIQPAEVGVVTQFGRFKEITQQGLNWHWPYPIEQVQTVNVEQVRVKNHKALMLTEDENIVEIELNVQYRIINAKDYLFNVQEPDSTLLQATESALREIVGTSDMDGVLTNERTRVATETKVLIQDILDRYKTGLIVISVNMQNAQPPGAVQAAFADVIKAREDEERSKNKAHAYANEVVEKASGFADQLREEAHAYKAQVVARAEGETKRFLSILTEYEKAPEITRQRLYFESMETVLSNSSKVMIDVQGNNLMVLPLDSILNNAAHNTIPEPRMNQPESSRLLPQPEDMHKDPRSRGGR